MLRASAACEAAGIPSSSIIGEGFLNLAAATAAGQGTPKLPIAKFPGHPGVQSAEELRRNTLEVTLDGVIDSLLNAPEQGSMDAEPGARDIIFKGTLDDIDAYFYDNEFSDGLPFRPPTKERVEAFLRYTDRSADEVLGILLPDHRAATVWSVAINGVMAGCRPEYMPVLVALIEAMADPYYGVEHSGNTPGSDTLITINGPIIKELGFNYTQGVMRDGIRANTSIGRFWRLYLRNVAGFLLHKNDKGSFGNTWRVVVAENEDVVSEIGWESNSVEMGFPSGTNTVTIARYAGGNHIGSVCGSTPEQMMPYLAEYVARQHFWHLTFTVGVTQGSLRPLILLSPILARTMAAAGWSKQDFKRALFEQARMPAQYVERILRDWTQKGIWDLRDEVRLGHLPKVFYESDDPDRLVPIVWNPEDFMVTVTGDVARNSAYIFTHNGYGGYPTAREIRLPRNWKALRASGA